MLSKKAATAITNVGKVHLRAFSLSSAKSSDLAPLGADIRAGIKADTPETLSQEVKDACFPQIGNRDIVGPSFSVTFDYHDMVSNPAPSVRWAPNTSDVIDLRKKEKGDWKGLSLEEKKQLYRNSFCQTFSEFTASTGEWKRISYLVLYTLFGSLVIFAYNIEAYGVLPKTYTKEHQQEMVASMLMRNIGPHRGISSKYDYDKNEWK